MSRLASPKHWTADEYLRSPESDEPMRTELLEGGILAMSPQNPSHAFVVSWFVENLRNSKRDTWPVRCQCPLHICEDSVPEPDLAVIPGRLQDHPEHPRTAAWIIEVSDTTLPRDRGVKLRLYARAGIPEYWIINLIDRQIEVHRQPSSVGEAEGYAERTIHRSGEEIPLPPPVLGTLAVDAILPPTKSNETGGTNP